MNGKGLRVVGIDVGKRMLEVAREGVTAGERHGNDAAGIAQLVRRLDAEHDV